MKTSQHPDQHELKLQQLVERTGMCKQAFFFPYDDRNGELSGTVLDDTAESDSPHQDEQGLQAQGQEVYAMTQGALSIDFPNKIKDRKSINLTKKY